jgi:hypothetical protein
VPADPLWGQGGVRASKRTEAKVVAASPEDGVATGKLAANAVTRRDFLRVQPLPERDGPLVDASSNHDAANVSRGRSPQKTARDIRVRLFTDNLEHNSLWPAPVPLAVEHALPGAQVELPIGHGYYHFVADGQVA